MRHLLISLLLIPTAFAVGFVLAWVVLFIVNALLPPFRPEDDDTWREFVPVALAYGTWAATTLGGIILAWRRELQARTVRSS
ncbi:MAG: hypothetical protein ABI725_07570 [Chloroflexota bacterium]